MVYEIYFEPKYAVWRIRITTFYFYFFAVSRVVQRRKDDTQLAGAMDFQQFDEADRFARRVGLDKAYTRRERRLEFTSNVQGVLAHGSSQD